MRHVEQELFRKHAKRLEVDQQWNIYDLIDSFNSSLLYVHFSLEWNTLVTEVHLEKALRMLGDSRFEAAALSDYEVAALLAATGRRCQMLSGKQRNTFTARMLQIFNARGVRLGLAARNALLGAQIDNNIDVDIIGVLKQYEMHGLIPDEQTYGQLSRIY
ncbi:unnamed protein product, partial [Gongylonema pulchrum]|uniref:NR LBD domain-containing protein n=1 Tax=Gongylonema pulchrum TaxID=637853 RepID=A0A183D3C3_9BILA